MQHNLPHNTARSFEPDRARSCSRAAGSKPRDSGLPPLRPTAPSLPPDLIPASLRPWLVDAAERAQAPLEFFAAPAVVALSSLIGRKVGIFPKRQDDWLVTPNLWGAVIGRPGVLKSPAIKEALNPLGRLADKARAEFESASISAEADAQLIQAGISALKDRARKAAGKTANTKEELAGIKADLTAALTRQNEAQIHERRYILNDPTVEKVGELLNQNPNGLLLWRDELSGWFRSLEKTGREGDREFYLESWEGKGRFIVDRIGRGTLHVQALVLSILGSTTPGKLSRYIDGALCEGTGDDGLLQRFQVIVWPESSGAWVNVDRPPDRDARNRAFAVFEGLDSLTAESVGAVDPFGGMPALRFAPDAQELSDEWRTTLERRLRSTELEAAPAFESHLAKYRSLMPSLALIFHLVEMVHGGAQGPVSLQATQFAAAWCEFLEQHAKKIYAAELNREVAAAHAIAERIARGDIEDGTPVRDIYRPQWSGLTSLDVVLAGLRVLEDHDWIRFEEAETEGRPSAKVYLTARARESV